MISRKIRFKAGQRRPVCSDNRWLKKQIRKRKGKPFRIGVQFTEDSKYAVRDVGGDNDQNDWFKIGGSMSILNLFKKQKEELVAFRYNDKGEFQTCNYERHPKWGGTFLATDMQTVKNGGKKILWTTLYEDCILTIGAWAGGDGILLNDFSIYVYFE